MLSCPLMNPPKGQFHQEATLPKLRHSNEHLCSSHDVVPISFSRQPPPHLPYAHFPPIFLIAQGHHLDKGFPICLPPSKFQPHPFCTHDVNEGDWVSFLEDIRKTATLTERDAHLARSVPVVNLLPVLGRLVKYAIRQHIKRRKTGPVGNLIERWNHHFFHPRGMEVVLMQGQDRLSGDGPIPNADVFHNKAKAASASSASMSSSSCDDSAHGAERGRQQDEGKSHHSDRRGAQGKTQEQAEKEKIDKTCRLLVVATM